MAAVVVVRLEHELGPMPGDEIEQVHPAAPVGGPPLLDPPGPGHVRRDRRQLLAVEEPGVPLVAQHRQAGLLVKQLAAPRVGHEHGAVAHRADQRLLHPTALNQLRDEHPLVHQVDRLAGGRERSLAILQVPRIRDQTGEAHRLRIVAEDPELALGRHVGPVENGDRGSPPAPRAGPDLEQRVQYVMPYRERPYQVAAEEAAHPGEGQEELGEHVAVSRPGRRLGVVFGASGRAVGAAQEGVQPAQGGPAIGAGILQYELFLPRLEPELGPDLWLLQGRVLGRLEGPEQGSHRSPEALVGSGRQEPGPQHAAERPVAEEEPPGTELLLQPPGRFPRHRLGQPGVVVVHDLPRCHGAHAPTARRAGGRLRSSACQSRGRAGAEAVASRIASRAMCWTAHSK